MQHEIKGKWESFKTKKLFFGPRPRDKTHNASVIIIPATAPLLRYDNSKQVKNERFSHSVGLILRSTSFTNTKTIKTYKKTSLINVLCFGLNIFSTSFLFFLGVIIW